MDRMFRAALVAIVAVSWSATIAGCGDSAGTGAAERSEAAVKGDAKGQDAMKEFMQSKSGKKAR